MSISRSVSLLIAAGLMAAALPVAADDTPAAATTGEAAAAPVAAEGMVEDNLLEIAVNRLHAEAGQFFSPNSHSLSVLRLADGFLASADGDEWHVSLSAAKAYWVVIGVGAAGAAAVEPWAGPIFQASNNGAASRVVSLVGSHPNEGVDGVNDTTWSWGMENTYMYGWFNHIGTDYGWHISSHPLPNAANPNSIRMYFESNITTTDDLASFWAMLAEGELLDPGDTETVLAWGRLPRSHENHEMLTNRLPAAVAAEVSHKSGWNGDGGYPKSRRIDGGLVTLPDGTRYTIAVSFRTPYEAEVDAGGASWGRYAACEIYNVMAGADRTCTQSGDPSSIVDNTTAPIGGVSWAAAERDRVRVKGWALDRDIGADPIDVRITVDGTTLGTVTAGELKASVHDRYGFGNYHGFSATFDADLDPGTHQVCAVGINDSAAGSNRTVGCRAVTVSDDHPPIGALAEVRVKKDLIVAWGWARDLDTGGPIRVKMTVDGGKLRLIDADRGTGGHGFKMRLAWTLEPGEHEICAIAQNHEGAGPNRTIGCETVTVPADWPPAGTLLDATADTGGVWVFGRAWDDDTADPIEVRVEVDGSQVGTLWADLGANNRRYGGTIATPLDPGEHTVCTVAVNHTGGEPATDLGCLPVMVAAS